MQNISQIHPKKSNDIPESIAMTDSIGHTLTKARIARDLDQKEIARHLNVDQPVIQAIENDELDNLGAPVFVRNYLKRYAALVGLSENVILERYRQLGLDELPPLKITRPIQPQAKMSDLRWVSYPLIIVTIGWLGWLGLERIALHFDSSESASLTDPVNDNGSTTIKLPQQTQSIVTTPKPAQPVLSPTPNTTKSPIPSSPYAISSAIAQSEDSHNNAPAEEKTTSLAALAATKTKPDETDLMEPGTQEDVVETSAPSDASETATDGEHKLVLSFTDDCWVEVKDANGKRLAYGVFKANAVSNLSGLAPFTLTLGNAGAASLTLDGNTVERSVFMPKRGTVSRFTLDAPQG